MSRLTVFNNVSLDGYFTDANGDMSWARRDDPEWNAYAGENASGGESRLLFGRVTYQLMESFWPTPEAMKMFPAVAEAMNSKPKIVFSRTLDRAAWNKTTVIRNDLTIEVRKLKEGAGADMIIIGSGTIVSQLAAAKLIDEYQLVVIPTALGRGRTLFETVREKVGLVLKSSRVFGNGNVVLQYVPAQ